MRRRDDRPEELAINMEALAEEDEPEDWTATTDALAEESEEKMRPSERL